MINFRATNRLHYLNTAIEIMQRLPVGSAPVSPVLTGLKLWLDSSDIATLFQDTGFIVPVSADGQTVKGQKDKSGNNYHVTEATNAPIYKASIQNGLGVVRFDGINNRLRQSTGAMSQPYTLFLVGKANNIGSTNMGFFDGFTNRSEFYYGLSNTTLSAHSGATIQSAPAQAPGAWHYFTVTFNGASSIIRQNGIQVANGNAGTQSITGFTIGAAQLLAEFLNGDIGEILFYDPSPSDTDRDSNEAYLANKWGL